MKEEKTTEVFGDYNILNKIGQFIWGEAFFVEHRFIKKKFTLQLFHSELSSHKEVLAYFESELVKLASLNHSCIPSIENVSMHEDSLYIVREAFFQNQLKNNITLTQYLFGKSHNLDEEDIFNIIRVLSNALSYAHENQIVHGCLHPDSIIIDKTKEETKLTIVDFGLEKLFLKHFFDKWLFFKSFNKDKQEVENIKLHLINNKLSFLAPEVRNEGLITFKSDIYSLGVLAYYLMFKKHPEGMITMPSKINSQLKYNWDNFFSYCLSSSPEFREENILSLLQNDAVKKESRLSLTEIPREINVKKEEISTHLKLPIPEKEKNPKEEKRTLASENSEEKEFVLVTAKSIDEAMQTKITKTPTHNKLSNYLSKDSEIIENKVEEEETSYTEALQNLFNRDPVVTHYYQVKEEKKRIQPIFTDSVLIEGREFLRGSSSGNRDELPVHKVIVDSFFIDVHPVTNEQFAKFLEFVGSEKDQNYNDLIRLKESRIQRRSGTVLIEPGYFKHPVVGVTWYGAIAYSEWIGRRLPTEAEWEIACRGGEENQLYPCGDVVEKQYANFFSSDTTPVTSYPPNNYGLYDMVGNVYEWCSDWYGYDYYETSIQEPYNPKGPSQGVYRVLRGGCWKSLKQDLRCSHRHRNNPGTVNSTYGFRCAYDVR